MSRRRLRAVIADDEPLARRIIRDLLAIDEDVTVVAEARNGLEAVGAIRDAAPDLLFLDVDMPDLDGFGVLEAIEPHARPHTVFVTAYDEFAVRAFEDEALDYLVKPFTDDRFRKTLARARSRIDASPEAKAERAYLDGIPVTVGPRTQWVPLAQVRWIEADDYYARLHTSGGVHLVRIPLATLERRVDPHVFIRAHRGALVNRAAIDHLKRERGGAHVLVLDTGERVAVSERRWSAVNKWLAQSTA